MWTTGIPLNKSYTLDNFIKYLTMQREGKNHFAKNQLTKES